MRYNCWSAKNNWAIAWYKARQLLGQVVGLITFFGFR